MGTNRARWALAFAVVAIVASLVGPAAAAAPLPRSRAADPPLDQMLLPDIGGGFVRGTPADDAASRNGALQALDKASPGASALIKNLVAYVWGNASTHTRVVLQAVELDTVSLASQFTNSFQGATQTYDVPQVVGAQGYRVAVGGAAIESVVFQRGVDVFVVEGVNQNPDSVRPLMILLATELDQRLQTLGVVGAGSDPSATTPTTSTLNEPTTTAAPAGTTDGGGSTPTSSNRHRSPAYTAGQVIGLLGLVAIAVGIVVALVAVRRRRIAGAAAPAAAWGPGGSVYAPFDPTRPQPTAAWPPAPPPPPPPPAPTTGGGPGWPAPIGAQSSPAAGSVGVAVATRATPLRAVTAAAAPSAEPPGEEAWLGTTEAAALLGVTPGVVRRMISSGGLPATRDGREYRIRRSDALARRR